MLGICVCVDCMKWWRTSIYSSSIVWLLRHAVCGLVWSIWSDIWDHLADYYWNKIIQPILCTVTGLVYQFYIITTATYTRVCSSPSIKIYTQINSNTQVLHCIYFTLVSQLKTGMLPTIQKKWQSQWFWNKTTTKKSDDIRHDVHFDYS